MFFISQIPYLRLPNYSFVLVSISLSNGWSSSRHSGLFVGAWYSKCSAKKWGSGSGLESSLNSVDDWNSCLNDVIFENWDSMESNNWLWNWWSNSCSDWRSASGNVCSGAHDLLLVHDSDLVDSSLSVKLVSQGLVGLDE